MSRTSVACLFLLLASAASALAQSPASALPPAAQDSINKGIAAANAQDYLAAIQNFQDARKVAGDSPEILFNLGLAESRIPGRELRSISWFAAYLAAAPGAANAAAVQQEINALDAKSRSDLLQLIKLIQDTTEKIPSRPASQSASGFVPSIDQNLNLVGVANLWAETGDMPQALALVAKMPNIYKFNLADALAKSGQLGAAKSLLAGIPCDSSVLNASALAQAGIQVDRTKAPFENPWFEFGEELAPDTNSDEISSVATTAAEHGDAGLARELLQPCVATGLARMEAWAAAAQVEFEKGDSNGTRASLAQALKSTRAFHYGKDAYVAVACLQAGLRDFGDADKTINKITDLVKKYTYTGNDQALGQDLAASQRDDIVSSEGCVARAHLQRGEIAAAQMAAARIPPSPAGVNNDDQTDALQMDIARAQLIHGDSQGAQKTAALIQAADKRETFRRDMEAFLKDPSYFKPKPPAPVTPGGAAASRVQFWIAMLDDPGQLNQPIFMDLPGYLKNVQSKAPAVANGQTDEFYYATQTVLSGLDNAVGPMADMQSSVDKALSEQIGNK